MGNSAFSWKPTAGVKIKIGTFTRDNTAATGDVAITGVGFKPDHVLFFASVAAGNTSAMSIGGDDGSSPFCVYDNHQNTNNTYGIFSAYSIIPLVGMSAYQGGKLKSLDSDGFTISWTKVSSPTGTTTVYYVALAQQAALAFTGATLPSYQNLAMAWASNTTVTVTADKVAVMDDALNTMVLTSLSDTVDITASGVNGLDTGSEAVSTWYHIWCIAKQDGTKECLLSASATAPTLPAGYSYKCYLGAVYNNSSGNLVAFKQINNYVHLSGTPPLLVNAGTATSLTSVDMSVVVPSTAKLLVAELNPACVSGGTAYFTVASDSGGLFIVYAYILVTGGTSVSLVEPPSVIPIHTPQTIWYMVNNAATSAYISVYGWYY